MKMERTQIVEKLRDIIATVDESKKDMISGISEDTEILMDLEFSSLEMVHLSMLLEDTFNIRLEAQNVQNMRTIGDVADLVETCIEKQEE